MEKNKTGKYLKNAIGEIVLVVIGILLALQANNRNQNRIERHKEKRITTTTILHRYLRTSLEFPTFK